MVPSSRFMTLTVVGVFESPSPSSSGKGSALRQGPVRHLRVHWGLAYGEGPVRCHLTRRSTLPVPQRRIDVDWGRTDYTQGPLPHTAVGTHQGNARSVR